MISFCIEVAGKREKTAISYCCKHVPIIASWCGQNGESGETPKGLTETAVLIEASNEASLSTLKAAAATVKAASGALSFQAKQGKIGGKPFKPSSCCIFKFDVFFMYKLAIPVMIVNIRNSNGIKEVAIGHDVRCANL